MAAFPALVPTARPSQAVSYAHADPIVAASGSESRVLLSNAALGPVFDFTFILPDVADWEAIADHWTANGLAGRFDLDAATIGSYNTTALPSLAGYLWRYVQEPRAQETCEAFFVSVSLERLPPINVIYGGALVLDAGKVEAGPGPEQSYRGTNVRSLELVFPGPGPEQSFSGAIVQDDGTITPGAFG